VLAADGHLGYAQPIGGVIAYQGQISISGVGFDIACGNAAARLDLRFDAIKDNVSNTKRSGARFHSASAARTLSAATTNCSMTMRRGRRQVDVARPATPADVAGSTRRDPIEPSELLLAALQRRLSRLQLLFFLVSSDQFPIGRGQTFDKGVGVDAGHLCEFAK